MKKNTVIMGLFRMNYNAEIKLEVLLKVVMSVQAAECSGNHSEPAEQTQRLAGVCCSVKWVLARLLIDRSS